MPITLQISLPEYKLAEEKADKVVLPVPVGTLTVIEGRAPTVQLLTTGAVQILNRENKPVRRWFISGGVADIAEDVCRIGAEEAVDIDSLVSETAAQKAAENPFYQSVYEYLRIFG